jgi:hypothetical protein
MGSTAGNAEGHVKAARVSTISQGDAPDTIASLAH